MATLIRRVRPASLALLALGVVALAACGSGGGGDDDVTIQTVPLGCEGIVERFEQRLDGISFDGASLGDLRTYGRLRSSATDALVTSECEGEFLTAVDDASCTALSGATPDTTAGAALDVARDFACDDGEGDDGGGDGGSDAAAPDAPDPEACEEAADRYGVAMSVEYDRIVEETGLTDPEALEASDAFVVEGPAADYLEELDVDGEAACGGRAEFADVLAEVQIEYLDEGVLWPRRPGA